MSGKPQSWSTPGDIAAGVQRLWDNGALLAASLGGNPLFAYALRLRQPGVADMGERFDAVLRWFRAHPRPGIYLRQLDIEGVDTKFIEARKVLLAELLDRILPADAVLAGALGARQFEARYGLLSKPALIRFRILDPAHRIGGAVRSDRAGSAVRVPAQQRRAHLHHRE